MARPRRIVALLGGAIVVAVGTVMVAHLAQPDLHRARPQGGHSVVVDLAAAQTAIDRWLHERASSRDLADANIEDLRARLIEQSGPMLSSGHWSARVGVTWDYGGVDSKAQSVETTITLANEADGVHVIGAEQPSRVPLWLGDQLRVSRSTVGTQWGEIPVVVTTGRGVDHVAYLRWATKAAEAVADVLRRPLPPLVVEVPQSAQLLEGALGANPGTYRNVAAVTASVDGSTGTDAAIHVFVNPEVMAGLEPRSAQIVMTHEAVHALTRAPLNAHRPLWLSEGFADYVALGQVQVPLRTSASQIAELVRADGAPPGFPADADFDADSSHFGAMYEAAWLAVKTLADVSNERAVVQVYDEVGNGRPVGTAVRSKTGKSMRELVTRWRHTLVALSAS